MGDKGAEGREEIYVAWYEGEQLEEWNEDRKESPK